MRDLAAGRFGTVVRAKGLAATDRGPWRFDLAFGNRSSGPFAQPITESRLVVIGKSLNSEAISRAFPADRTS
ncbi:MAG: GTP-binding protein [Candidatus Methylomirabilia bacterium]